LDEKAAAFTDVVIFSDPIIGIQEKQSVIAKKMLIEGLKPSTWDEESFKS
jgi:hypothetical protein